MPRLHFRETVVVSFGTESVAVEFSKGMLTFKRVIDVSLASCALILLLPFFGAIALAIVLDSGKPVFYRQLRLGKQALPFVLYKFRSMIPDAENMEDGLFTFDSDKRITRIGAILRNTGLDELPQLWNVIKGDMSLVGPRPPVHNELGDLRALPRHVLYRFTVRPGVTGLAQVSGRNELSWPEKVVFDSEYVRRLNTSGLLVDVPIIFSTFRTLFTRRGLYDVRNQDQTLK